MEELYKILITGTPIGGKTNLARKLEEDLIRKGLKTANRDVDYDLNWEAIPLGSNAYILQTPHGSRAEEEDGIRFNDFNKILYVSPDKETQRELLKSRAIGWFDAGVTEWGVDKNPQPHSVTKLPGILDNILRYASRIPEILKEDENFIKEKNLERITPILEKENLHFIGYEETFNEILNEIKS